MAKFKIEVCRTYYAFGSVKVEAETREEAEILALDRTDEIGFSIKNIGEDVIV